MRFWSDGKCGACPSIAELYRQMFGPPPLAPPPEAVAVRTALSEKEIESLRRQELLRIAKEKRESWEMYCDLCAYAGFTPEE